MKQFKICKVETFVPSEFVARIVDELNAIGALSIGGNYDYCIYRSNGTGCWRPLNGAEPFLGNVGEICKAEETKLEFTCNYDLVKKAVQTIKQFHPYEEAVINILPMLTIEDL